MSKTKKNKFIIIGGAIIFCVGLLLAFLLGCGNSTTYKKITGEEAKEIMESGKPYILLDVRTEHYFKTLRIDGSVLIPHDEIRELAPKELPDKKATILIYCRSGRRSALAATELAKMGYKNVYDFGGIIDWAFETISDIKNDEDDESETESENN